MLMEVLTDDKIVLRSRKEEVAHWGLFPSRLVLAETEWLSLNLILSCILVNFLFLLQVSFIDHLGSPSFPHWMWCCHEAFAGTNMPGGSVVKNPPTSAGDVASIPGLGRSLGAGNGNPPQYSCLENPMERGAWWAMVRGVTKSRTWLSDWACTHMQHNIAVLYCTFSLGGVRRSLFYRRGTNTEKIRKFPSDSVLSGRARSWTQDQHWEPYSLHSLLQKMGRWLSWIGCSVAECSVIGQRKLLLKNYLNHLSPVLTYVRLVRAHPNSNADNY